MENLLQEAINSLEKAYCDFHMCPGPDKPFENMKTCHTCYALQCLRKLANPVINSDKADILPGRSIKDLSHTITFNDGMDD